jgi:hypothetical protein
VSRRWLSAFLTVVLMAIAGCGARDGDGAALLQALGVVEAPAPPPIVVDVLCDASTGSTCTRTVLESTLDVVLSAVATRPGSTLRVWAQGRSVDETALIGTVTSAGSPHAGKRALASQQRWMRESKTTLVAAALPAFQRTTRRSPIAEGISRLALAGTPHGGQRFILVVTDGREVSSFGDFECGALPREERFVRRLHAQGVLAPRSIPGAVVVLSHVTLGPVDGRRCPVTLARVTAINALWMTALTTAGAAQVRIENGAPAATLFTITNAKKETRL